MRHEQSQGIFKKNKNSLKLILAAICLALLSTAAWTQETTPEYKLRVAVKSAAVHREPDTKSPVIASLLQGTLLDSSHSEGVWFRIVVPTGQEGIILVGYVSRLEVEILEEKAQKAADSREASPGEYRGIGLSVKLSGGLGFFAGGDVDNGASGMFKQGVDDLEAMGYTLARKNPRGFHSGLEAGADIIYRLSPKLGIGVGGSYIAAKAESSQPFVEYGFYDQTWRIIPEVKVLVLRLELTYDLPLLAWLGIHAQAGPAFFLVNYDLNRVSSTVTIRETYSQTAKANRLGFHGGLGLTFRINPQTAFILEARGRYARFSDLRGSETLARSQPFLEFKETSGSVYYVEGGRYPTLAVLADGTASSNARKAVFDFSGLSLRGGVMVRF